MEQKIKLAVRKEEGSIPGGGYHYMLHPMAMTSKEEAEIFALMGHVILEVDRCQGERLLDDARVALRNQCQVAVLTEQALSASPR